MYFNSSLSLCCQVHAFLTHPCYLELVSSIFTLKAFYTFTHVYIVTVTQILRFFPAKSIFCNEDKIMDPGGIPKIIIFLSHSFSCNR